MCVRARVYAQLTHTKLVIAVLGDVSHPRQRLVPTLFHDLEIPHLPPIERVNASREGWGKEEEEAEEESLLRADAVN